MQLHRLEVEGFGPFRERQIVDFDAFADDGIFLIEGRTGAGKSSILDAVCFGLYGGVPRYESGDKRLRSDHCEPDDVTEVVVEFSTPAGRYRVRRSPEYERPKKRGGGMTVQASSVQLDALVAGEWIGLAAKEREAAYELDDILQLSREQFLQVILLAQNRFSEFLLAGSRERQALLRRLFGTERFEDVQARFDERRRAAEQELASGLAVVAARLDEAERLVENAGLLTEDREAVEGGSPRGEGTHAAAALTTEQRLDELALARARADYRAERRAAERDDAATRSAAADATLSTAREERRAQQERDRARQALARLEEAEPQIVAAREELSRAREAETLRTMIVAAARADAALVQAVEEHARAQRDWDAHDVDAEDLSAWASERTRETGAWRRADELERSASARESELREAAEGVTGAADRLAAVDAEGETLPVRLDETTRERDALRRIADRSDDLATALQAATGRVAAAHDVVRLEAESAAAEQDLVAASSVLAERQTELARLRQRRLDGFAGELASALVDGGACPVCGAHEHPAPADHTDPVSADDIVAAEARRDDAVDVERSAAEKVASLRVELAAASSRADGRDVRAATDELTRATDEHAQSLAAAEQVTALDRRAAELSARIAGLQSDRESAAAALAAARETHAIVEQREIEAASAVAEARGAFPSVAERITAAEREVTDARTLIEATDERARRADAAASAARELSTALDASAFDDADAAEAALRSPLVQAELEARISHHAVEREKERAILLDLELRTLPEEPIDLDPIEQRSAEARSLWSTAVADAERAAALAEQLGSLIGSASAAHAESAAGAADFEVLRGLADALAGRGANTRKMTLETFVLAAELEEIVEAANRRLADMSTGRYQLRHSDALAARGAASGLGIVVFDAYTGQTRPAQSLSGGETFLSSLALALGLAEVVTARAGGIRLDTLFIDEGFGSLDGDTLDVAMRTLDELRQGGRTVGVISHVEAMKEQIPAQLSVRATPNGPSVIETR
ncbi:SMC family ATPase [Microbacterium sp. LWO14-1.2]|uniref:SMC family ATPase n=1 Tax=Microbacterium sp. LWO14-1.2 TaxID=3135263 RepID=UPI00313A443F